MLDTKQLAIWRERRPVLHDINLHVDRPGLLFLVGPGGSGKSSLLQALRGDQRPDQISIQGRITLGGDPLAVRASPIVHVPQNVSVDPNAELELQLSQLACCHVNQIWAWAARHGIDISPSGLRSPAYAASRSVRRALSVLALLENQAELYLIDEPTAGIEGMELDAVRARIASLARQATIVIATHNRRDCMILGGFTSLLAGGRIWETAPSYRFFKHPATPLAKTYVATGNCTVGTSQPEADNPAEGLWWLDSGQLCGMSRPGLMTDLNTQFQELSRRGIAQLYCLEERYSYSTEKLRELGIAHYHFPIADMSIPTFSQAVDICRLSAVDIDAGKGIAMHCRGGLGRTGTMLAVVLVWHGHSPESAIQQIRVIKPHAIQTDTQIGFIHDFADRIRDWH